MGGVLLSGLGFVGSLVAMAAGLLVVLVGTVCRAAQRDGQGQIEGQIHHICFPRAPAVNWLSAARLFLFGARDVWFVVGLPVFLASTLGWSFWQVGAFAAAWFIGYGMVQAIVPEILRQVGAREGVTGDTARLWAFVLVAIPLGSGASRS